MAQFAHDLRQLRRATGLASYRELANRTRYSVTVLADAASGNKLPTLPVTLAFAEGCGADPSVWEQRWRAVSAELRSEPRDRQRKNNNDNSCPYLGAAMFRESDSSRFFGRDELISELRERLTDNALVAVSGPSGSGKSSVVRAGLLPALAKGDRPAHTLLHSPGERPLTELAELLDAAEPLQADLSAAPERTILALQRILDRLPPPTLLVIVVDQLEELFTRCHDERERAAYLDSLLIAATELAGQVRVLLTIRSDFAHRCAEHVGLANTLRDRTVPVGPMTDAGLRSVIADPAAAVGCSVEPALVERVVMDSGGYLPVVSRILREIWNNCDGRAMTLAAYRDIDGVRGVLARLAEDTYGRLDSGHRRLARKIFLRLVALGEGEEDTRRRSTAAELVDGDDREATADVLTRLAQARLIVLDEDHVLLAHEAVAQSWPRLRHWLTEDRWSLRVHRRLAEAATDWDRHDRDRDLLYRNAQLLTCRHIPADHLNDLEQAFLTESRDVRKRERVLRRCLGVLAVALLAFLLVAIVIW